MQYGSGDNSQKNHVATDGAQFVKRKCEAKTDRGRGHNVQNTRADEAQVAGNDRIDDVAVNEWIEQEKGVFYGRKAERCSHHVDDGIDRFIESFTPECYDVRRREFHDLFDEGKKEEQPQ